MKTFSFWIWKSYEKVIRQCVSVPNFNGIMFRTFPVLHFFFRLFLQKNFIECVSSPYVDNFILLDSNLTNSMKSNFLSDTTIKVIWFEIFSKWKSFFEQWQDVIHIIYQINTGPSQVLISSRHKQIFGFFIFSLFFHRRKKCMK